MRFHRAAWLRCITVAAWASEARAGDAGLTFGPANGTGLNPNRSEPNVTVAALASTTLAVAVDTAAINVTGNGTGATVAPGFKTQNSAVGGASTIGPPDSRPDGPRTNRTNRTDTVETTPPTATDAAGTRPLHESHLGVFVAVLALVLLCIAGGLFAVVWFRRRGRLRADQHDPRRRLSAPIMSPVYGRVRLNSKDFTAQMAQAALPHEEAVRACLRVRVRVPQAQVLACAQVGGAAKRAGVWLAPQGW